MDPRHRSRIVTDGGDAARRRTAGPGPLRSYTGRAAVLATKHDKLPLVAPPLAAVGREVLAVAVDTDRLGTFTGEIPRPGSPRDTAIAKARLAMAATGSSLGLASEGSIGPHPATPLLTVDVELLVLVDDELDILVDLVIGWAATPVPACCGGPPTRSLQLPETKLVVRVAAARGVSSSGDPAGSLTTGGSGRAVRDGRVVFAGVPCKVRSTHLNTRNRNRTKVGPHGCGVGHGSSRPRVEHGGTGMRNAERHRRGGEAAHHAGRGVVGLPAGSAFAAIYRVGVAE